MLRLLAPTALVLALSLACLDEETEGDRLTTAEPSCPPGEFCSTVVGGLVFHGRIPESHGLFGIARGGVQRIAFRSVAPRAPVELDASTPRDSGVGAPPAPRDSGVIGPVPLPVFDVTATSSVVQVLSSNRLVVGAGEAVLRGVTSGTTRVRVTERATDRLLDRVEVRVAEVAHVDLLAEECNWWPAIFGDETRDDRRIGGCGAVWAGSEVRAALSLVDANGEALWDDTLTHGEVAPTKVFSTFWAQGMVFDVRAPMTGELQFEVTGASGTHVARLPVVSDVADIQLSGAGGDLEIELSIDVPRVVCAAGMVGGEEDSDQGAVLGAPAAFRSDSAALVLGPAPDAELAVGSPTACQELTLTERASHLLTVTMGSMTKVWTISPVPVSATALRREPSTSPRGGASLELEPRPGERLRE